MKRQRVPARVVLLLLLLLMVLVLVRFQSLHQHQLATNRLRCCCWHRPLQELLLLLRAEMEQWQLLPQLPPLCPQSLVLGSLKTVRALRIQTSFQSCPLVVTEHLGHPPLYKLAGPGSA